MTTALLMKLKVMVMEWPSMSPDLNPIENMWGILKRKVEKHHVSNIQAALWYHYGGVEEDASNNLCNSGEFHAQEAVLDNIDAPTKYWHFGHSFDVHLGCTHFCCQLFGQ